MQLNSPHSNKICQISPHFNTLFGPGFYGKEYIVLLRMIMELVASTDFGPKKLGQMIHSNLVVKGSTIIFFIFCVFFTTS